MFFVYAFLVGIPVAAWIQTQIIAPRNSGSNFKSNYVYNPRRGYK